MTSPNSVFGERLQAIRRRRGFKSARELADAMRVPNVTEAILRNVEAGRKSDLSVSQLLNIAYFLGVPPSLLLAPVENDGKLSLPNLSADLEKLSAREFDAWMSGGTAARYVPRTSGERDERNLLQASRELDAEIREIRRLRTATELENSTPGAPKPSESRLREAETRADELRDYLSSGGWMVGDI